MKYAVFFRNLNLGRRNCPDRTLLERAFAEAGALRPASFQVNGTLVFEARGDAAARAVLNRARRALREACGLAEPAFVRRMEVLAALVAADPFAGQDQSEVYDCCVSFLAPGIESPDALLPLRSTRGDVEVFGYDRAAHAALALSRQLGAGPGSPNALLERVLGTPVTTRNWGTLTRLVARHVGRGGKAVSRT
ncbi:MAG TPA: DUF1697 domain-containing protein [Roseateles sp.]|nr:DUF1697 domain-containing protein [Roseateles sp.]